MVEGHGRVGLVGGGGGEAEAVVGVSAIEDLSRKGGDGAGGTDEVGGVVGVDDEGDSLDAVVLAESELGDVHVLRVGGRCSIAVGWVGAVGSLRSGCRKGNGEESGGNGDELHDDG